MQNNTANGYTGGRVSGKKVPKRKTYTSRKAFAPLEPEKCKINCLFEGTFIDGGTWDAHIKPRPWIVTINPRLKPVGLRRDNKRAIYVNGRKFGKCFHCYGVPDMPTLFNGYEGISGFLAKMLVLVFGWRVPKISRGFYEIKLKNQTYIVRLRIADMGAVICHLYYKKTGEELGIFMFTPNMDKVIVNFPHYKFTSACVIMIGCVMECLANVVFSSKMNIILDIEVKNTL